MELVKLGLYTLNINFSTGLALQTNTTFNKTSLPEINQAGGKTLDVIMKSSFYEM